jgi:hypothetical protein
MERRKREQQKDFIKKIPATLKNQRPKVERGGELPSKNLLLLNMGKTASRDNTSNG